MEAYATIEYEDQTGRQTYRMAKNQIVIGRGGRDYWTDLKLNTLPDVSREHVRLRRDAQSGEFFIKDLSRLGTSVNGESIPTSVEFVDGEKRDKNVEVKLPASARIGLADVVFLDFRQVSSGSKRRRGRRTVIDARENQPPVRRRKPRGHGAPEQRRPRALDPDRGIFLVVDGIGGQAAGEKAADIAINRVRARLERQTGTAEERIREAIAVANNEILRAAAVQPRVARNGLRADRGGGWRTAAPSSATWAIRACTRSGSGEIRKITHDHSPVGEREDNREISETEAMRHPRRNEVYRDVGSQEHAPDDPDFIELLTHSVRAG